MRGLVLLGALSALIGCATADDAADDGSGGDGKADGATCEKPQYGDGRCHLDLGCGIPDVDCFKVFATDEQARMWLRERRSQLATLPSTDPLARKARTLLDTSWQMFQRHVPVGALASKRLSVVVVDESTANGFVLADGAPGVTGFAVMVNKGTLVQLNEAGIIGLFLHEISHIVRQHTLEDVKQRTLKYYVATGKPEQLGYAASDNARVEERVTEWIERAELTGVGFAYGESDVPVDGTPGEVLNAALLIAKAQQPSCEPAITAFATIRAAVRFSQLTQDFRMFTPADLATLASATTAVKSCLAPLPAGTTLEQILPLGTGDYATRALSALTAEQKARLLPMNAVLGLLELNTILRANLKAYEVTAGRELSAPWSAVRYYTTEEHADDDRARIARKENLSSRQILGSLWATLGVDIPECERLLTSGAVPYGRFLSDTHHGSCWRIAHSEQIMAGAGTMARTLDDAAHDEGDELHAHEPYIPTEPERVEPLY